MNVDMYYAGSSKRNDTSSYRYDVFNPVLDNTSNAYKWYYWDSSASKYVECTGNHDGYQKVIH